MNNILYISGDDIRGQIASKIYTKHFISDAKNYFISKAINSIVKKCDILNFCFGTEQLKLHLKLVKAN